MLLQEAQTTVSPETVSEEKLEPQEKDGDSLTAGKCPSPHF